MLDDSTLIYFIRHGEVHNPKRIIYGSSVDVPLNELGFRQMEILAARLRDRGVKPDVIYTSHLLRAIQSAEAMAKIFPQAPIRRDKDLRDTDEPGLKDKTLDWLESIGGDEYNNPALKDFEIERPEKIVERVMKVLAQIREEHEGKTIFVVSHGDPIAFTMWRLLHPEGQLPPLSELGKHGYLKKAESWRAEFNREGKVIEHELVSREDGLLKKGKESTRY